MNEEAPLKAGGIAGFILEALLVLLIFATPFALIAISLREF